MNQARVAVLIPCFNEAVAIGRVVADFRKNLDDAVIYVYDNNSTFPALASGFEAETEIHHSCVGFDDADCGVAGPLP